MTRRVRWLHLSVAVALIATACGVPQPSPNPSELSAVEPSATPTIDWHDPTQPVEGRVEALLAAMTQDEKIGQMTQLEKGSIDPGGVTALMLGSVLSGGGGAPIPNDPDSWYRMVDAYQKAALATRLGIPMLYGVDAVHGHNNVVGATIFPHEIGLGAANDTGLVERIGRATAVEMAATGIRWDFGPVVAVPQDVRWGRTYEGYGEDPLLVSDLGSAFIRGLQGADLTATDFGGRHRQALRGRWRDGLGLIDDARLQHRPGDHRSRRGDVPRAPPDVLRGGGRSRRAGGHGVLLEHQRRQGARGFPPAHRGPQG